jgi:hypothetical protein
MSSGESRNVKLCDEHGKQISELSRVVHGGNGELGMRAKVQILWRSQIWIVGLVGVAVGSVVTMLCNHLLAG